MASVRAKPVGSITMHADPSHRSGYSCGSYTTYTSQSHSSFGQSSGPQNSVRLTFCGPTKNPSSSSLNQTSAHHKWQHLKIEAPQNSFRSYGTKAGFFSESGQLIGKLSTRRGFLQKRPKCCQAVSKLAEGGRSTASFVAFPTKKAHHPSTERPTPDHWQDRRPSQAGFKWALFYLGLSAAAASLLRSNAKLVLAVSLLLAAYALRSGVLDMIRGPFEDSAPQVGGSKAAFDDRREKQGNQNGVKANAGASGGQQLAAQETSVAAEVEVVRPVHFTEEGLRPVRDRTPLDSKCPF